MNRLLRKFLLGFWCLVLFAAANAKATIWTVNSTADPGTGSGNSGSLRYCTMNAASGDTITFQSGVTGTITLSSALPTINKSLTITGPGAAVLTISGANAYQVFDIASGATASISDLTIANGSAGYGGSGGAIANSGNLTLISCTLSGNTAPSGGGAIANYGNLTLISCTLSNNTSPGNPSWGGAILNGGSLTLTSCTLSNNTAFAGGGAIFNDDGGLTVTASTFTGNTTSYDAGGAIFNVHYGVVSVVACTFSYNVAGEVAAGSGGGAIYQDGGPITVTNSTFTGNSVRNSEAGALGTGGAIWCYDAATLIACTISGNQADYGGGIYNSLPVGIVVGNCIIAGNTASSPSNLNARVK
jgi:hypothetical protein